MASIYKHSSGYYHFRLGPKEARLINKPERFSTSTKSKKLADEKLRQLKKEIAVADISSGAVAAPGSILFSEAFEQLKQDKISDGKPYNTETLELYDRALKYFYISCGDRPAASYKRTDFHAFAEGMREGGLSQNSQAMYSARIHTIFNWMQREGHIQHNPFKLVAPENKLITIRSKQEIDALFNYAKGKKFEPILKFMYLSAFRATEAVNLRFEDIKKDRIIVKGKGGKNSWIPITKELQKFLSTLPKKKTGKVFNVSYHGIRYFFYRAEKQIGFRFYSHDLRKYRISLMANAGVNIFFVKNYARHSNIKTTLKYYAGADLEKMKDEIDKKLAE